MLKRTMVGVVVALLAVVLTFNVTIADNRTWDGDTTSVFSQTDNWVGGNVPSDSLTADVGVFNAVGTSLLPSLDASRSILGLDFTDINWALNTSGAFVLSLGVNGVDSAGAGTNTISADLGLGADSTWTVGASNVLSVSSVVSNDPNQVGSLYTLIKNGDGELQLSGVNTFGGAGKTVTVSVGTLTVNADSGLGDALNTVTLGGGVLKAAGTFSSARGISLTADSGVNVASGKALTLTGIVSGANSLTKSGAGALVLSATNTFGGATKSVTVSGGVVSVSRDANLGNAANSVALSGGGALLATSSLATSRGLSVGVGGGELNTVRNQLLYLGGAISGSTALAKTGLGNVAIAGDSSATFTGSISLARTPIYAAVAANLTGGNVNVNLSGTQSGAAQLVVRDGGILTGMTAATVGHGTQFVVDNRGLLASNLADRLGTSLVTTMNGGTLIYQGSDLANSTETMGKVVLNSGANTITVGRGSSASYYAELTLQGAGGVSGVSQVAGSGATVNFTASAGTLGGVGAGNARIYVTTPGLVLDDNIIGAWARVGVSDWATYGATGVAALPTASYVTAAYGASWVPAANVKVSAAQVVGANTTINSLIFTSTTAGAGITGAGILNIASGGLMDTGHNHTYTVAGLTAGGALAAGTTDLTIYTNLATTSASGYTLTMTSIIQNNGLGNQVRLVKDGAHAYNVLYLNQAADNTYTGGTIINTGVIQTGTTASRAYLGTGAVTVKNGAMLSLGNIGATSAGGTKYTAVNGGVVYLGSSAGINWSTDSFDISAYSVISGVNAAAVQGLNSLVRGANITLAENAIVAHQTNALGNDIGGLLTNADLFFGVGLATYAQNQTIGTGTAWKGLSNDRNARIYSGALTVNSPVTLMGIGNTALTLTGDILAGTKSDIDIQGLVTLNKAAANYSGVGYLNVNDGAVLTVTPAAGLGSGGNVATGVAVLGGGRLIAGAQTSLNVATNVAAGGILQASVANGLTGLGAITLDVGAIVDVTVATGIVNTATQLPASAIGAGRIVRLNVASIESLNVVNAGAVFEVIAGTTQNFGLNLNIDSTVPVGFASGVLTNDYLARTMANGNLPSGAIGAGIIVGANGGVIAATTGTTLTVTEEIDQTSGGDLILGYNGAIDGNPKLGIVVLNSGYNANTASVGAKIQLLAGAQLTTGGHHALADQARLDLDAGSLVNWGGHTDVIGSLNGSGTIVVSGTSSYAMILGGDGTSDAVFSGVIRSTTSAANLGVQKILGGTQTLSGANAYYGNTNLYGGEVKLTGGGKLYDAIAAGTIEIRSASKLTLDETGAQVASRLNSRPMNLYGGELSVLGNASAATISTVGTSTIAYSNTVSVAPGASQAATLNMGAITHSTYSSNLVLFKAANLGGDTTTPPAGGASRVFINTMTEGTGQGTNLASVIPYAIGYDTATSTWGMVTYNLATGVRLLNTNGYANEYSSTISASVNARVNDAQGFGGNVTLNSLVLDAGAAVSAGGTLTLNSDRTLLVTGNASIDVAVLNLGTSSSSRARMYVASGSTFTVDSPVTCGYSGYAGLMLAGPGNYVFNAALNVAGGMSVEEGNVLLPSAMNNPITVDQTMTMNGGTLDLNGSNQRFGAINSGNPYVGGTITSTAAAGVVARFTSSQTFAGQITGGVSLSAAATGYTWTLAGGDSSLSGAVALRGGTVLLRDGARLSNASEFSVFQTALSLDNNQLADNGNRVADDADVLLRGGTVNLYGRGSTASAEQLGDATNSVQLLSGANTIQAGAGQNGTAVLTLNGLMANRAAGATANFVSLAGTLGTATVGNPRILFAEGAPGLDNGIIAGWAINGASDFATYGANGVAVATGYDTSAWVAGGWLASENIKVGAAQTITADTNVNSFIQNSTTARLVTLGSGVEFNVESGGLVLNGQAHGIVGTDATSILTAGGTVAGELDLFVNSAHVAYVSAVIADNYGADLAPGGDVDGVVSLVKSGTGTLRLDVAATYTGATYVSQGLLTFDALGVGKINTTSALTLAGGSLTLTAAEQIANAATVTIRGGSTLTTFALATETIFDLELVGDGGAAPTVAGTGTIIVTNASSIKASNYIPGVNPTISATVNNNGNNLTFNMTKGFSWMTDVTDLVVSGKLTGSGGLVKTGNGLLALTFATNDFGGGANPGNTLIDIQNGTLSVAGDGGLGNPANTLQIGGATAGVLRFTAATASIRNAKLGAGGATIEVTTGTTNWSGSLSDLTTAADFTKAGAGTLVLLSTGSLSNAYTGDTSVLAGTLGFYAANQLGTAAGTTLTMGTATLSMMGSGTATLNQTSLDLIGNPTFTGSMVIAGGSTTINDHRSILVGDYGYMTIPGITEVGGTGYALTLNGAGMLTISGASNYTGGTALAYNSSYSGVSGLTIGHNDSLGTGDLHILAKATYGEYLSAVTGTNLTIPNNVIIDNNPATSNASYVAFGRTGATGNLAVNGSFDMGTPAAGNQSLRVAAGMTLTLNGELKGTANLIKNNGAGTLALLGTNTFTGVGLQPGLHMQQGKIQIDSDSGLGDASNQLWFEYVYAQGAVTLEGVGGSFSTDVTLNLVNSGGNNYAPVTLGAGTGATMTLTGTMLTQKRTDGTEASVQIAKTGNGTVRLALQPAPLGPPTGWLDTHRGGWRTYGGILYGVANPSFSPFGDPLVNPIRMDGTSGVGVEGIASPTDTGIGVTTYTGSNTLYVNDVFGVGTTMTVAELVRNGKAILMMQGVTGNLGSGEDIIATIQPNRTGGIVPAYMIYMNPDTTADFLTHDGEGTSFRKFTGYIAGFAGSTMSYDVVQMTADEVLAANKRVFSLKIANDGAAGGPDLGGAAYTLTVGGRATGGGLLGNDDSTIAPTLQWGLDANTEGLLFVAPGKTLTVGNMIAQGGGMLKFGGGTLVMGGLANDISGDITISDGRIVLGTNNALGTGGVLSIQELGSLNMAGYNQQVAGLTGAGPVLNSSPAVTLTINTATGTDYTYSGVISDNISLVKSGNGTERLTGANTFTGTVDVNGGILVADNALALNTNALGGTIRVNTGGQLRFEVNSDRDITMNGGTLRFSEAGDPYTTYTSSGTITLNAGNQTFMGPSNGNIWSTYSGLITGAGKMVVAGGYVTGGLNLNGVNNNWTGGTDINLGGVNVRAFGALGGTVGGVGGGIVNVNAGWESGYVGLKFFSDLPVSGNRPQEIIVNTGGKVAINMNSPAELTMPLTLNGGLLYGGVGEPGSTYWDSVHNAQITLTADSYIASSGNDAYLNLKGAIVDGVGTPKVTVTFGDGWSGYMGSSGVWFSSSNSTFAGGMDVYGTIETRASSFDATQGPLGNGTINVGAVAQGTVLGPYSYNLPAAGVLETRANGSLDSVAAVNINAEGIYSVLSEETKVVNIKSGGMVVRTSGAWTVSYYDATLNPTGNVQLYKGAIIGSAAIAPDRATVDAALGTGGWGVYQSLTGTQAGAYDYGEDSGLINLYRGMAAANGNLTFSGTATESVDSSAGIYLYARAGFTLTLDNASILTNGASHLIMQGAGVHVINGTGNTLPATIDYVGTRYLQVASAGGLAAGTTLNVSNALGAGNLGWLDVNAPDALSASPDGGVTPAAVVNVWNKGIFKLDQSLTTGTVNIKSGGALYLAPNAYSTPTGEEAGPLTNSGATFSFDTGSQLVYAIGNGYQANGWYSSMKVETGGKASQVFYATYALYQGLELGNSSRLTMTPTGYGTTANGSLYGGTIVLDSVADTQGMFASPNTRTMTVYNLVDFGSNKLVVGSGDPFSVANYGVRIGATGTTLSALTGFTDITQAGTVRLANAANKFATVDLVAGTLEGGSNGSLGASTTTVNVGAGTGAADVSLYVPGTTQDAQIVVLAGTGARTLGTNGSSGTIHGGVTLNKGVDLYASSNTATFRGVISGGFGVNKTGNGTVSLLGKNTFTGAVSVLAGTLRVDGNAPSGAAGALGNAASTVVVGDATVPVPPATANNASLLIGGGWTVGRNISVAAVDPSGTVTLGTSSAVTSYKGIFSGGVTLNRDVILTASSGGTAEFTGIISGGGFGVTKTGNGSVSLTAGNTYSGLTVVQSGGLRADPTTNLLNSNLQLDGGVLEATSNLTVTLGVGSKQVDMSTGSGGFAAYGAARTVTIAGGAKTWGTTANFLADGSSLLLGSSVATQTVTLANAVNLGAVAGVQRTVVVADNVTGKLSGVVSGAAGLTVDGDGLLELSNAGNSYTGRTILMTDATLKATSGTTLPTNSNLLMAGGVLQLGANFTRALGTGNNQVDFSGVLLNRGGGFSAVGADVTVNLGGAGVAVAFDSDRFVPYGYELILNTGASTNKVTFANGIAVGGDASNQGIIRVTDNDAVTTDEAVISGAITGIGGIYKAGDGQLTLTGANTFTGLTTVDSGDLVLAGGALGGDVIVNDGAELRWAANNMVANGALITTSNQVNLAGFSDQVADLKMVGGSVTTNGGTLTLSGSVIKDRYDNDTDTVDTIGGGGGTLALTAVSHTFEVREDPADGMQGLGLNVLAVSADITGAGAGITKTGTGVLVLSGNNSFNGQLAVTEGLVRANSANALGAGNLAISGGSIIELGVNFSRALGAGAGAVDMSGVGGGGFAAVGGNYTVNLAGGATWASGQFLTDGTALLFGSASATGNVKMTSNLDLNAGAVDTWRTIDVADNAGSATDSAEISGVISSTGTAAGAIIKTGDGTLVLSGVNTYGELVGGDGLGWTEVQGGAIRTTPSVNLANSNLVLKGGVLELTGHYADTLGFGAGKVSFQDSAYGCVGGGFAAVGGNRNVTLNGAADLVWGFTPNFLIGATAPLIMSSATADSVVTLTNNVDLNNTASDETRTIVVNAAAAGSMAALSGNLTQSGLGITSLAKAGTGTLVLSGTNAYTGTTRVLAGTLRADDGVSLGAGNLWLGGGSVMNPDNSTTWFNGVLETSGLFTRATGTGDNQVNLTGTVSGGYQQGGGGFSAYGADLVVDLGGDGTGTGPAVRTGNMWGGNNGFTMNTPYYGAGDSTPLVFGSETATHNVTFMNQIAFDSGPNKVINVVKNTATMSGSMYGINNACGLVKTGAGKLVLAADNAFGGSVDIRGGTLSVVRNANLGGGGTVTIGNGATLEITGTFSTARTLATGYGIATVSTVDVTGANVFTLNGTLSISDGTLNKVGTGTFVVNGATTISSTLNVNQGQVTLKTDPGSRTAGANLVLNTNNPGSSVVIDTQFTHLDGLNINDATTVSLVAGGNKVLSVESLTIETVASVYQGKLDLTNNRLVVDYAVGAVSPLVEVNAMLKSGFDSGWAGTGIVSTTATVDPSLYGVGVIDQGVADAIVRASFADEQLDTSSVILRYTYLGDADLNGVVDGTDFSIIANGFNMSLSGWQNGDFNYDGLINGTDFSIIANSFNMGGQVPLGAMLDGPQFGGKIAAVPEPATLALLAVGAVGFVTVRIRRRRAA